MFRNLFLFIIGSLAVSLYSPFLKYRRFGLKKNKELSLGDDCFDQAKLSKNLNEVYKKILNEKLDKDNYLGINDITDKSFVLKNFNIFKHNSKKKTLEISTSGTTGQGLKFSVTQYFMRKQWKIFEKQFNEASVYGKWTLQFSGRDLKIFGIRCPVFIDLSSKKVYANQYCLNSAQVNFITLIIKFFGISWIHGYPSMVVEYIEQVTARQDVDKISFSDFTVTMSSETFTEQQEKYLRNNGISKIYNMYGQSEGVANFFTCKSGWMHVNESFSLVEFIKSGELFEIVGTSLHNAAFTFYRYKTGDFVEEVITDRCECGRLSRRVSNVLGRQDDYIILKDGSKVGRLDHLTKGDMRVHQAQVVQKIKGAFILYVSCDPENFQDLKESLTNRCVGFFDNRADVEIRHTTEFILSRSGKWKFVVNLINSD